MLRLVILATAAGCSFQAPDDVPSDARTSDGGDAGEKDPDAQVSAGLHVLLSEIELDGNGEMMELYNPTSEVIELETYYLSDSASYWRLPANSQDLESADFIARFPPGTTLPPGGVITVAIEGVAFQTRYASPATFSFNASASKRMQVQANGTATLTNGGEMVVLFRWDGMSDLVEDVDLVIAGSASGANSPTAKLDPIDGPDSGSEPTMYAEDAMSIRPMGDTANSNKTHKRLIRELEHETHAGTGNGITGDDETSEQLGQTWDLTFSEGTPGTIPDTLKDP